MTQGMLMKRPPATVLFDTGDGWQLMAGNKWLAATINNSV
jgi:hypothetical protein